MAIRLDRDELKTQLFYHPSIHRRLDVLSEFVRLMRVATEIFAFPLLPGLASIRKAGGYFDGRRMHIWIPQGPALVEEDLYYGYMEPPFTSITYHPDPVMTRAALGVATIRDPSVIRLGDTIYVFVQTYDGTKWRPNYLLSVPVGAESDPASYTNVGVVADVGPAGAFDETWVLSPAVFAFGGRIGKFYEAANAAGEYRVGLCFQSVNNPATVPYRKFGPIQDHTGASLINPTGVATRVFGPNDIFFVESPAFIFPAHYHDGTVYKVRGYVSFDSIRFWDVGDIHPVDDGHTRHIDLGAWWRVDEYLYYTMIGWDPAELRPRVYRIDVSTL